MVIVVVQGPIIVGGLDGKHVWISFSSGLLSLGVFGLSMCCIRVGLVRLCLGTGLIRVCVLSLDQFWVE